MSNNVFIQNMQKRFFVILQMYFNLSQTYRNENVSMICR